MRTQFTQYLRAYRLAHGGMSAGQAATAAGISENTWRQYEAGSRPGSTGLARLARYFDRDEDWDDPEHNTVVYKRLETMAATPCDPDIFETAQQEALRAVFDSLPLAA